MYYFTADEHMNHNNSIKYSNRPFKDVDEMNSEIINRHNSVVGDNDIVIHAGDYTLSGVKKAYEFINKLRGTHSFLCGSHDYWNKKLNQIWEGTIGSQYVVVCHYAMRVWARSHYNSWMLYGHSHGHLKPQGKQWDIGVDNNDYYPVSFNQLKHIMDKQSNNFNLIK